jgi:hypothetical protein
MVIIICIILQSGSQFIFKTMTWNQFQRLISDSVNTDNQNNAHPLHLFSKPGLKAVKPEVARLHLDDVIRIIYNES